MSLTSVDILKRENKKYTYETHAAHQLGKAFEEMGIASRQICLTDGSLQDYLLSLQEKAPSMTLSFVDPLRKERPLCDVIQIPHLLLEPFSLGSLHYLSASHGSPTTFDRHLASSHNLCFFPHVIDPVPIEMNRERLFDIVLFADLVDVEKSVETWETLFKPKGVSLLKQGVEICQNDPKKHPVDVALSLNDPEEISLNDLAYGIESYLVAERTLQLIESFEEIRIDVFGDHVGNNWLRRLKNRDHVYLHSLLPFSEHFEVLKLAKIVVRNQPSYADASDPWMLPALKAGCYYLSNPTPYLSEQLPDAFLYRSYAEMLEKVREFLANPNERAFSYGKKIIPQHTWLKRAYEIQHYYTDRWA